MKLAEQSTHERELAERTAQRRGLEHDRLADIFLADDGAQARAEDRKRKADRDLVGLEADGEHAEQEGEHRARQHPGADAEPQAAGERRRQEARHRAAQHHALDAEVEHPGALGDELAERRVDDRRAGDHRRDQDPGAHVDHVAASAVTGAGGTVAFVAGAAAGTCVMRRR
jgi:hypothetical protein